ncbi:MAG TPA: hypothetical protein VFU63_07315 [Ktedonobacterales bacterium]|nr:hypothetical protein [Ktedonobacterales bacterium]
MRNYRGRGSPNESTRRGRGGGSGSSWRAESSGRRGRSGSDWGGGGDEWQDNGYDDEPPPARSNRRNRRPPNDYDEVDLDRAMVPARNDMMMPVDGSAGLPAIPGLPQTDEEERAIGMRRPAYIPATNEKRKRKLSSWRVISGVLSVMLACILSCAAAGILGRDKIQAIIGNPVTISQTPLTVDLKDVPVTPVATPGPQAKLLSQVVTARARQSNCAPVDPTSLFHVNDAVWVFVILKQAAPGHTISVRWFANETDVNPPSTDKTSLALGNNNAGACFSLQYPSAGTGMVKIYWDRPANDTGDDPQDPALMATIRFGVVPANYGTPTPAPAGTAAQPTATPKK